MMPYFSCPFSYYAKSAMGMPPPIEHPLAAPPMPVAAPPMPVAAPPAVPGMPPIPPMPVCPITGMPAMGWPAPVMPDIGMMPDTDEIDDMDYPLSSATGDPPPILSNNPAVTEIVLFKELTGYPNYGNPSGNADILYTGTRGVWTFDLPPFLYVPATMTARLLIRAVLDDHYNVPVSQYSATIIINGTVVHSGPLPLEHGTPAGAMFNNWRTLVFNVPVLRRTNRVVIINTSSASPNDWIGLDWMEMRITPR